MKLFFCSMAVGTPTLDTSVANLSSNLGGTPRSIRPLTQAYRWEDLLLIVSQIRLMKLWN